MQQSAQAIYDELHLRGLKVEILNERRGLLRFHDGMRQRFIHSAKPDSSSSVGVMLCDDKELTAKLAVEQGLRTPQSLFNPDATIAEKFLDTYAPLVVKPVDGAHGNGVSMNVKEAQHLATSSEFARTKSGRHSITIQEQVAGEDVRLLVIGDEMVAAAVRKSACVKGDGVLTIRQLIVRENELNPDRAANYTARLNYIDVESSEAYLGAAIDSVVPLLDQEVQVVGPSNVGKGGTATDVTDKIPVEMKEQAIRLTRSLGLSICGVDFIASDIEDVSTYYFIEANACPSLGLHLYPTSGRPRLVATHLIDYMLQQSVET
jgi:cyanophycin synthetase